MAIVTPASASPATTVSPYTGQIPVVTVEVTPPGKPKLVFRDWTGFVLTRSLHELAASVQMEFDDQYRGLLLRSTYEDRSRWTLLRTLMPATVRIDGEAVLRGWIEDVAWEVDGEQMRAELTILDPAGDLLQCSANPDGPAEYKGLTALQIVQRLVAPFGFTARAEADVGAPIGEFSIDVGETVFSAIDKACKQRALLPTSDGLGGLVLTRSGGKRAPGPIGLGAATKAGAMRVSYRATARDRFSDYWVKGQSRGHRGGGSAPLDGTAHPLPSRAPEGSGPSSHSRRPVSATPLDGTAVPLGTGTPIVPISVARSRGILGVGHAVDPEVTRYRPHVWVARTGGGGAPHQVLAEWHMRVARARAQRRVYTEPGFRAGSPARLWRANEVVSVELQGFDPYDLLIEGVTMRLDGRGARTDIAVVGIEAYDLEPLGDGRRHHADRVDRLPR